MKDTPELRPGQRANVPPLVEPEIVRAIRQRASWHLSKAREYRTMIRRWQERQTGGQ
jgi:hypothetical protein